MRFTSRGPWIQLCPQLQEDVQTFSPSELSSGRHCFCCLSHIIDNVFGNVLLGVLHLPVIVLFHIYCFIVWGISTQKGGWWANTQFTPNWTWHGQMVVVIYRTWGGMDNQFESLLRPLWYYQAGVLFLCQLLLQKQWKESGDENTRHFLGGFWPHL